MSDKEIERVLSSPELPSDDDEDQDKSKGALSMIKCEECGLTCAGKSHYNVHIRSHTGERPYVCHICGFGFTQKGNLRRHYKIHSDEKPYECPLCSYKCRRRDALNGHMRIHSDQRPYRCSFCDRSYKSRQSMKEHEYQCPFKNDRKKANACSVGGDKIQSTPVFPNFYNPMMRFPLPHLQSLASTYLSNSIQPLMIPGFMNHASKQMESLNTTIEDHQPLSPIPADKDSGISENKLDKEETNIYADNKISDKLNDTSSPLKRKRKRDSYPEEDVKCTSPKVAKIVNIFDEPKEEARSVSPYDKCSSSSLVDDIIVYKNGCKLDIWTCDLCKCIFLDKSIYSIHMGAHVQQTVMKWHHKQQTLPQIKT